ncbi:NAD(P)H-hydrate epimerase [Sphingomonas cannabina]|uniref:NAD(P)H-hydrate epimerase n=1 Tax=Sphingomonas cannabina TaxID=2899123 RepID=UPI001F3BF4CC|nr:NAD(P)H-hydrate epimerase [Sphingomonas cannabina]UIJ43622.1 NAD(P)H-hydrate epimerase [Sphingomonas cannabina]
MRRIPEGAPIVTAAAMRAAEEGAFARGVSQDELMERAGASVALEVARLAGGRRILVLAGPGNNGGDAWVAARWLAGRGHDVNVAELPGKGEGSAGRMRARWTGAVTPLGEAAARPVLVDGLFGTGITRPLVPEVAASLARLTRAAELVVAIDIPSGVTTEGDGLDVDVTVALGALKPEHVLGRGIARSGHVLLADIDVPVATDWRTIARPRLAAPEPGAHKYSRGMVGVIAGAMPGAARLAARAAMRCAGYVVLAGAEGGPDALVHREVEDLFDDERIGALVIGPGLGGGGSGLLDKAIASDRALVLDGDALSILGNDAVDRLRARQAPTVLTPHSGEFTRMFGEGEGGKIERTLAAAGASGCTIVHKGADTVIASPGGSVVVEAAAPSWLASAGTGDVLAGLVAGRIAAGGSAEEAVWLHARAAEIVGPALIADELIDALPRAIAECL